MFFPKKNYDESSYDEPYLIATSSFTPHALTIPLLHTIFTTTNKTQLERCTEHLPKTRPLTKAATTCRIFSYILIRPTQYAPNSTSTLYINDKHLNASI